MQKFAQKLPKIAKIPKYNAVIQILLNLSTYFCIFQRKIFFVIKISSKKVAVEPRAGVNEAIICSKSAENCKYSYLQCNNSNTIEFLNIFLSLLGKHI